MAPLPPMTLLQLLFCQILMPWYDVPDVWIAIGTMLLAGITAVLAFFTYRLYQAAQNAREDSQTALAVSRETMSRSLRAYVIVDSVKYEKQVSAGGNLVPKDLRLTISNSGQVPSNETTVTWTTLVKILQPPEKGEHFQGTEEKQLLVGIIAHDQKVEIDARFLADLIERHQHAIASGSSEMIVRGVITYRDGISDDVRQTTFNYSWNAQRNSFFPKNEAVNRMT